MNTTILLEALRTLDTDALEWKFGLYSKSKGRDGLELDWSLCKMRGIASQAGRLKDYLLKKPVADKPVSPYSPFLSDKENICAIDAADEMIRDQVSEIILSLQRGSYAAPEDYVNGVMPKTIGFAFYGENAETQEKVLMMRRGNPFLTGASARLYTTAADEVVSCEQPILKFANAVDFLIIGGACYIFSSAIEKDLAMENRYYAIAEKRMNTVAEASIISDLELLQQAVYTSKNARKFLDFDNNILEHIVQMPIAAREDFLITYGVTVDSNGSMDTSDPEQCELIIDLLCCRSCLDPLGRLSVGSNITPRD